MFTLEFLSTLEYLLVVSRCVLRRGKTGGGTAGDVELFSKRQKQLFGKGTEFADHRVYVQGDDLRHLDWNLFARLGERFIKRFEINEDVNIYFLLDSSASMQAGTGNFNKYDYARRLIASLSYIALCDLNRVGVFCFANGICESFPAVRGKGKFLNLLKFLEQTKPTGTVTDIRLSIGEFIRCVKRSGIVVIVSDFFDRGGFKFAVDRLRYNKFEPMIIQLHTDFEFDPQLKPELQSFTRTNFNLVSIENEYATSNKEINDNEINVTINESIINQYKECFTDFLNNIKSYCIKSGTGFTIADTSIPFDELILQMIRNGNIIKTK
ncbi:MAG: DUF58 domain-containing protein [Planctomycetaceae bacterium]|jgi:hypothetical protein|nr:DUF58 domain-containing protein [Planctomycetaceae bacterium]